MMSKLPDMRQPLSKQFQGQDVIGNLLMALKLRKSLYNKGLRPKCRKCPIYLDISAQYDIMYITIEKQTTKDLQNV